jgi:hypothetical protein
MAGSKAARAAAPKDSVLVSPIVLAASAPFWLGDTAAVFCVLPLVLPAALFELSPVGGRFVHGAFRLSRIIALGAAVCLAANLWLTARPST